MSIGPKKRARHMALMAASRAGRETVSIWWDTRPTIEPAASRFFLGDHVRPSKDGAGEAG
jgi:hypothetical protein